MRFLEERIGVITRELKELIYKDLTKVEKIEYKKGLYYHIEETNDEKPWEIFDSKTMHWYGPDEHYWFRFKVQIPENMVGKKVFVKIATQVDHWDDAKNPQFLAFVNGVVNQGLDINHQMILLSKCASLNEEYTVNLQAYTGIMFAELNLNISLVAEDEEIKNIYYDIDMPYRAFARMNKDELEYKNLLEALNNTINLLDLRDPYSEEFYNSIKVASEYIKKEVYTKLAGNSDVIASCIGHTHIDVAWWWTVAQTREKVARSFATVLELMEEYPNYHFMSSQPQLYEFIKERYPDLYLRIKEKIKEKKWEGEGGMWVEADCNLTSGESLVRQFYYGKKFFKDEFNLDNEILWLPDVFGYSGALPQIMKKSNIKYFMTTKLAWNQVNKIPNDTLVWRGIDGSEILTHLITTLGVGQNESNFFTTYNGMLHPDAIIGGWHRYQNKDINNDILVSYGYGDGGGGPTRDMLEISKRMEKGVKGIPKVRQVFAKTYFDELDKKVSKSKRLNTWEGEFYFEYHRGTYTSMGRNKRFNRKCELLLMDTEFFNLLADNNPKEKMEKIWKLVLRNQFHDILPGSSIKEVYDVSKVEYEEITDELNSLIEKNLGNIVKSDNNITIFNTLGFRRDDVVFIKDINKSCVLVDDDNNEYKVQKLNKGSVAYIKNLPSKGGKTYRIVDKEADKNTYFTMENNIIKTPIYTIRLDDNLLFESIYDKENDREVLKDKGNLFRMYEDKPMCFDCWDIDMYYSEKYWDALDVTNVEFTEVGEVRATLIIERKISKSTIKQKIHFYKDSRRIDFETYVDWKEHQNLLKVHFPVNIHNDEASFDIQFGHIKRKQHKNTSWDEARFESCAHKWIDLSEGNYGVSLLNDCKYGHSVNESNMAITLIKSGIEPNKTADQEEHTFTYSLYPHDGGLKAKNTIFEGYKINKPAYTLKGTLENQGDFVRVNKDNVIIETIKIAEDNRGYIIRCYEAENSLTKFSMYFNSNIKKVFECNLMEEDERELSVNNNEFKDEIKPFEIKTYRIIV